ncbi:MAG: FAD-dependent oxidoreductase [Pseudomonadota bacterium]
MDRRKFITALGAGAVFPSTALGKSNGSGTVDVVVIGAGAAGISATRELTQRGLNALLIEAGDRIGGRVYTDMAIFGAPYDVGAHWLHNGEINPFVRYGQQNGFDLYRSPEAEVFYVGNRKASDDEYDQFERAKRDATRAITRAGEIGRDVAPSEVVPDLTEWNLSANLYIGAYEMAKDFDQFSCADWYSSEDGTDWYCRQGFGTLFNHSSRHMNVELNTPAQTVRWGKKGVSVETNRGTINAKAVIITVSTGVLATENIKFDPPLPVRKQEAIQMLSMGHYNHIALKLEQNFFGIGEDGYFSYKTTQESNGAPKGFGALVDASGHGITYCDVGGQFAKELSDQGIAAMQDFVIGELERMFGSDIKKAVSQTHVFDWTKHSLTKGAYASASPGGMWARKEIRRPEADRLWFAGEATSKYEWATVAGAHKSGIRVAKKIAKTLKS